MSYDNNVYYNPEKFGLEQVASIEYSSQSYEYDTRVIWRHTETGKLYTARDSGCSCPSPFEAFNKLEDLAEFGAEWLIDEAREEAAKDHYRGESVVNFIMKIHELAGGP